VIYTFLFALAREAVPFCRQHRREKLRVRWKNGPPCEAHCFRIRGSFVTVLITGIGFDRARQAALWVVRARKEASLIVAAGFAGALDLGLKSATSLLRPKLSSRTSRFGAQFCPPNWVIASVAAC